MPPAVEPPASVGAASGSGASAATSLSAMSGAARPTAAVAATSDGTAGAANTADEHDLAWRRHKRHFFILTHAGAESSFLLRLAIIAYHLADLHSPSCSMRLHVS